MDYCKECAEMLSHDEIGLCKKLCGKNLTEFMCINCMAEYFSVTRDLLEEKVKHYKDIGCTLFN